MRGFFFLITGIVIFYYMIMSCASPQALTGGPKDSIPPIMINSIPFNKSTNFKGNTIVLEYNERIQVKKIKEQLIITPRIDFKYDYFIKKNILKITFDGEFKDSTTYTLNFRESIQDITEGNPTKDNKFTFSTGNFIDSLSVSGIVKKLLTNDTLENILVGLYRVDDTVTIFNGSPYYFTETDEDGQYLIENIKNGRYFLYAFNDANKNLKLETKDEAYGFIKDTLLLDTANLSFDIYLINLDLNPFKINSATTSGKYFDVNFNKYITDFSLFPIDFNKQLYANRAKENKSIRFYNTFENEIDSIGVSITAYDSLNTEISDTVFVKFIYSKRKTEPFKFEVKPPDKSEIEPDIEVLINFNKPVIAYNTDSLFFRYDNTLVTPVPDSIFHFNKYYDELSFSASIDKVLIDTLKAKASRLLQHRKDSIAKVKTGQENMLPKKQQAADKKKEKKSIQPKGLQLYVGSGAFYSADKDTSEAKAVGYRFLKPEDFGTQEMTIDTDYKSFIVQLVTKDFTIFREVKNEKSFVFKNIPPGEYKIRVLIDANNDGKWHPGNMLEFIEPEPVYIYPQTLIIRADWRTSLNLTF